MGLTGQPGNGLRGGDFRRDSGWAAVAGHVTIWYTVTAHEGRDVISIQHVSLDT
jgi:hypothetical protein